MNPARAQVTSTASASSFLVISVGPPISCESDDGATDWRQRCGAFAAVLRQSKVKRLSRPPRFATARRIVTLDPCEQSTAQRRNVECDQRKSDRDHPEAEYRQKSGHATDHAENAQDRSNAAGHATLAPLNGAADSRNQLSTKGLLLIRPVHQASTPAAQSSRHRLHGRCQPPLIDRPSSAAMAVATGEQADRCRNHQGDGRHQRTRKKNSDNATRLR